MTSYTLFLPRLAQWASPRAHASPTLFTVSFTAGTGRRGREVWKLYNMGFRPEKILTIHLKKKKKEAHFKGRDFETSQKTQN